MAGQELEGPSHTGGRECSFEKGERQCHVALFHAYGRDGARRAFSMNKEAADRLWQAGINLEEGTQRVAGNEGLFIRLLKKFPMDPNYAAFNEALEKGELVQAERHLHALKGVSANLSMVRLHPACQAADAELKEGRMPHNMEAVRSAYEDVVRVIESMD